MGREQSRVQQCAATQVQACVRGFLARQSIWHELVREMQQIDGEIDGEIDGVKHNAAVRIQAWQRGVMGRTRWLDRLEEETSMLEGTIVSHERVLGSAFAARRDSSAASTERGGGQLQIHQSMPTSAGGATWTSAPAPAPVTVPQQQPRQPRRHAGEGIMPLPDLDAARASEHNRAATRIQHWWLRHRHRRERQWFRTLLARLLAEERAQASLALATAVATERREATRGLVMQEELEEQVQVSRSVALAWSGAPVPVPLAWSACGGGLLVHTFFSETWLLCLGGCPGCGGSSTGAGRR
jgi:hypothetical protein